tara:strand:+ start:64 stop:492 length:429 start_codon:yes stop_codon:yes gene_type:complete
MDKFEIFLPLTGGLLIGVAASMLLLLRGKIAGVSGIFGGMLFLKGDERAWRFYFITGLIVGGIFLHQFNTEFFENTTGHGIYIVIVSGLLVGIGTRIGKGCTSGHGVCGIGKLSGRSIMATITFIVTGIIIVTLLQSFFFNK